MAMAAVQAAAQTPKLVYSTYVGTESRSDFRAIAVDSAGFAYVGIVGLGDGSCSSVTKLNQSGTRAVWRVCLPLTDISGLAIDGSGFIYVAGTGPVAETGRTSFVMKLAPNATETIFVAPIADVVPTRIVIDKTGAVYLTGAITGGKFQTTPGAYSPPSALRTFAAKLDPSGALVYAARLDLWTALGIAADSAGRAWIVGSSCNNMRCAGNALAIRKLDESGSHLLFSRSLGGVGSGGFSLTYSDEASAVAVGPGDEVWVTGVDQTSSIPTTADAILAARRLSFVPMPYALKLASSGEVLYGTYLNFVASISTGNLVLDDFGNPYFSVVHGELLSTILGIASDGSRLLFTRQFSSLVGSAALDGNGGLYVAGGVKLPLFATLCPTTPGTYQPSAVFGRSFVCAARFDLYQAGESEVLVPLNAATLSGPAVVAPGESITMYGMNLPPNPVVVFDGIAAPIVSASATQIRAAVPFGIRSDWTFMDVAGVGGYVMGVWPYALGLFTTDGSGVGQLDARNADGGVNSKENPAAAGSVVSVYMTGAGAMTPAIADGVLGPAEPPFPVPILPIFATINGAPAKVVLAAQAAGRIAGVVRVDIQVPAGMASGDAVVKVNVGSGDPAAFPWQPNTTIAIR